MMQSKNLIISTLLVLSLVSALLGCGADEEAPVEIVQSPPEVPALTVPEIAEIALKSTVLLDIEGSLNRFEFGSGFVVADQMIATSFHIIEGAEKGSTARLVRDPTTHPIESVVATDKEHDLAIVRCSGISALALPLGNSDTVQIGQRIYVAGNPDGYLGTFSTGVISAIRPGDLFVADKVLQMTAPISSGSSGGPVLNDKGEVIGIVNGDDIDGQNLNFAIPVNFLKALLATIQ